MPGQWLLKSPARVWTLDALLAEYPTRSWCQTHRDPLVVISSISAWPAPARKLASDGIRWPGRAPVARDCPRAWSAPCEWIDDGVVGQDPDHRRAVRRLHERPVRHHRIDLHAHWAESPWSRKGCMREASFGQPGDGGGSRPGPDTGLDAAEGCAERVRPYQEPSALPTETLRWQ